MSTLKNTPSINLFIIILITTITTTTKYAVAASS